MFYGVTIASDNRLSSILMMLTKTLLPEKFKPPPSLAHYDCDTYLVDTYLTLLRVWQGVGSQRMLSLVVSEMKIKGIVENALKLLGSQAR